MHAHEAQALIAAHDETAYLRYEPLTDMLHALAAAYPSLCTIESIGQSPQGRQIWALTLTNRAIGEPGAKPALLVEGNIHAGEVTGAAAALVTAKRLLASYGTEQEATRLLDQKSVYVIPRVAVDGAELYLSTPTMLRSSPLPYPEATPPTEGLMAQDLDGDGVIRSMRIADPLGEWRVSDRDPRILVRRRPEEWEGQFYRLFQEGLLLGPAADEPGPIKPARSPHGLDFNRNFPAHWNPEAKQPGAGRYPLDQMETRALAEFMLAHPNISIYLALHTYGGVLLRPPSVTGDDSMKPADLRLFEELGDMCERVTGYPCRSSHHAFFHTPGQAMTKGSKDWAYDYLGMIAYTMELWDLDIRAGAHSYREIGVKGLMKLSAAEREADEHKRLQWNDTALDGEAFSPWQAFAHPQLGPVEIGGWDEKLVRQNCPPRFLPQECQKVADLTLKLGLTLPRLEIGRVRTTELESGTWRVQVEVINGGFLGTATTKTAVDMKVVKPVEAKLTLPEGGVLLSGSPTQELGQLEGFSAAVDSAFFGPGTGGTTSVWAEWLLSATSGAEFQVSVSSQRGGQASTTFRLGTK
jgi:murein tripeptide amidase MpaA